jgi:methionyl-tRNA formyltransferase
VPLPGHRLGFAASAPFGADVLERLAARHEIAFVLTQPDAAAGRGRGLRPAPAKLKALQLGLRAVESLDAPLDAETIVLVAYGRLIPRGLLEQHLWLNVHPSLLPRWRGAAPVERAIMAGDAETGVTIIKLVEELDAGPIAAQRAFRIGPEDDAGAVYDRAAELGAELLEEALPTPSFAPQPDEGVTYAEKLGPDDRELDWLRPAEELERQVRALSPHIGARAELEGRRVLVWNARIEDGRLVPVEVQPEGGRRMGYDEWRRGLR